jgi:hypothetical protein
MLVKEVVAMLTKYYKPEDELVITWLDKEHIEAKGIKGHTSFTDLEWSDIVNQYDEADDIEVAEAMRNVVWFAIQNEAEEKN